MGWYDRDGDGVPAADLDEDYDPEWGEDDPGWGEDMFPGSGPPITSTGGQWFAPRHEVELRFYRPPRIIECQVGGEQAEVNGGFALSMLHDQIRLWQSGWRRDPDTALDYCPDHAPGGLR